MELGPILRAMGRNKLRFGLTAAQIAVTLALVANCVTLVLHAQKKMNRPSVFDDDNLIRVLVPSVDPALRDDDMRRDAWLREVMARVREIPGVRAVSSTFFSPWDVNGHGALKEAGSDAEGIQVALLSADENLPDALGAEIDEGRWFTRDEVEDATERARAAAKRAKTTPREIGPDGKVREPQFVDAVVSRAFGQRVFGEGPLVGRILEDSDGDKLRVIGVLRQFYAPTQYGYHGEYAVFYPGKFFAEWGSKLVVRAEPGMAPRVAPMIDERLKYTGDLDPDGRKACLVSDRKSVHLGPQRMTVALMGLLIFLLLFVTSLGIAGLASFSVTERTRQIGARRALGATTNDILQYFLTESGLVTTIGLLLGAGLAALLNVILLRFFDGAKLGGGIVAASALLLWAVGLGAALPPALRASRISPAIATRNV